MPSANSTHEILYALAQMPLMDSNELAAVADIPERTARDGLRRTHRQHFVDIIRHTRYDGVRVRRWYVTLSGMEELARLRLMGESPSDLIAEFPMLSARGRRFLLRRLDAVTVLYRVALEVAAHIGSGAGRAFTWRWEFRDALDAVIQLRNGRTLSISRLGSTHSGDAIRTRFRTLERMHRRGVLRKTLLVVPGVLELVRAQNYMHDNGISNVVVTTERWITITPLGSIIWETVGGDWLRIGRVLATTPRSEMPKTRRPERLILPGATLEEDTDELDVMASRLSVRAREVLRLLHDCPFIRVSKLQRILGISPGHMRREVGLLSRAGLVCLLRIGRTAKQRQRNETRLCLSGDGRRYLQRVDRSGGELIDGELVRDPWRVVPHPGGDEELRVPRYRIEGKHARTLLRQRLHTDGVYDVTSSLIAACGDSVSWDLIDALPAHRWERRFNYGTRDNWLFPDIWHSIKPDASFVLARDDRYASFVLEFERTAKNPSKMGPKLKKYRTYYSSADTESDFPEGRPTVLFVFEKRKHAVNFARYARSDGEMALPMLVSSVEELEQAGSALDRCWHWPWRRRRVPLGFLSRQD